jgi:PKD repeat protein
MKLSLKIKLTGMLIALFAIILNSCKKDPNFITPVTDGSKPAAAFINTSGALAITFTNTSKNLQSSYWQFGDGDTSSAASPVHTYAVAGKYTVTLKVVSDAGYVDVISKTITAAVPAVASFSSATSFGMNVIFTNTSTSVDSTVTTPYLWDFGDGTTTSTVKNPDHKFPAYGTYNVNLRVIGLLGDTVYVTKSVTVADDNLLKGGDMEATASPYWLKLSSQNNNPPVFGYTGDKPSTGYDGCMRFPSFANSGGSTNELIYQAVSVTAGKQYKLSAQVKLPAGAKQCYLQFYITTNATTWNENNGTPPTQLFMSFNTWHGWSTTKVLDGDALTLALNNGSYGPGVAAGGIYTATATGTIYIGIQAGTWQGASGGDFLVDNVRFVQVN